MLSQTSRKLLQESLKVPASLSPKVRGGVVTSLYSTTSSKEIVTVNVGLLNERFKSDAVIDIDALKAVGLISNPKDGVKILGVGELDKKLTIKVQQFSKSAVEKIEAAGGKAEVI